jgi:hypothetical protein
MIKEPSASAPDANAEEGIATQQSKPDRKLSSQTEGNAEDEDDDAAPMSSISWPRRRQYPSGRRNNFIHSQNFRQIPACSQRKEAKKPPIAPP